MSTLQVNSRAEVVDANGTLQQHVGVIAVAATAIQIQADLLRDLHADMQSMAEHVHRLSAEVIKVSLFQAITLQMSYATKTVQCWRTAQGAARRNAVNGKTRPAPQLCGF